MGESLWIVGQVTDWPAWEFQGVFDDEQRAVEACKNERYFVGPTALNQELDDGPAYWPGAYYPICTDPLRFRGRPMLSPAPKKDAQA